MEMVEWGHHSPAVPVGGSCWRGPVTDVTPCGGSTVCSSSLERLKSDSWLQELSENTRALY